MTATISREAFKAVLQSLDAEELEFMQDVLSTLKAARDVGDTRPPEVILAPLAARHGLNWPPKKDEAHDRLTT